MTARENLREVVEAMTEDEAALVLAFYEANLVTEELSADDVRRIEENRAAAREGDKLSLPELRRSLGR